MQAVTAYLHSFSFSTVCLRLLLSAAAGGLLGYGRARRQRPAGIRTFMLTSIGACLSLILSLYEYEMLRGPWAETVAEVGLRFDGSRYAASVITGIGFLAAGTIIGAQHKQIRGLTTATGLFTAACIGIASGAGFYSCALITVLVCAIVLNVLTPMEKTFKRRLHNIDLYVEFDQPEDLSQIMDVTDRLQAHVYNLELERTTRKGDLYPSAILTLKLNKNKNAHSEILSSIAELPCVRLVTELVA